MEMYEAMGHELAMQYGGSEAHAVFFQRKKGEWEATTQSRDIMTSIRRFYSNTYTDAEKQEAINLVRGAGRRGCQNDGSERVAGVGAQRDGLPDRVRLHASPGPRTPGRRAPPRHPHDTAGAGGAHVRHHCCVWGPGWRRAGRMRACARVQFLGNFVPEAGKPALWELDTDYYLHSGNQGVQGLAGRPRACCAPGPACAGLWCRR